MRLDRKTCVVVVCTCCICSCMCLSLPGNISYSLNRNPKLALELHLMKIKSLAKEVEGHPKVLTATLNIYFKPFNVIVDIFGLKYIFLFCVFLTLPFVLYVGL